MSEDKRKVIIGLDGVPFRLIKDFTMHRIMPYTKKLVKEGTFRKMKSSIPEISSVSWSSIITGKNPGEHGIYGFTDIISGTYTISFPNFKSLLAKPFWQKNKRKKYVILNVPFTYPATKMNGCLVSGFVAPDLEKAVYPDALLTKLKELNYQIDVDSNKAHKSIDLFLKGLFETLEARCKAFHLLWDEQDWDIFMFVITGTDRLMHFLWGAYEDETHEYHDQFLKFFKNTDEIIGEISSRLNEDDRLFIISDHGFGPTEVTVNVNQPLKENGLLDLDADTEKKKYNAITDKTKAFALTPGRIYLNWKDRFPNGSVLKSDREPIIKDIGSIFGELEYQNRRVINRVFRKEEIYKGEHRNYAPDLILLANSGFNLKADISKEVTFEKEIFTGMHTYEDAIFISNGKLSEAKDDISVEDVIELANLNQ